MDYLDYSVFGSLQYGGCLKIIPETNSQSVRLEMACELSLDLCLGINLV